MAWEVFKRDRVPVGEQTATITKMGRLAFNKSATTILKNANAEFVEILWDKDDLKVGIRIAEKGKGVYTLSYGDNGNGVGFSCTTFLNFITYDWTLSRNFSAVWDEIDKMFVIKLPQEHLGKPIPPGFATRTGTLQRGSRIKKEGVNDAEENPALKI